MKPRKANGQHCQFGLMNMPAAPALPRLGPYDLRRQALIARLKAYAAHPIDSSTIENATAIYTAASAAPSLV